MKKFSEFVDKLTSKQASLCSSVVAIFMATVLGILFFYIIVPDVPLSVVVALFLGVILDLSLDMTIFKSVEKRESERRLKEKEWIISKYGLTKEFYTELRYVQEDMLIAIIDESGCKFYAKFNDEEKIELIIKNKDDNIIYSEVISDFDYFEMFFDSN